MASRSNRNITDFFKPFSQPKVKRISASERSASEPQDATASTTKVHVISRPGMSRPQPTRNVSVTLSKEPIAPESTLTPISSSPPSLPANTKQPTRVPVRELSPLSSLSSSPSPPSPPPTVPKKQDSALLAPIMDPNVSSSSLSSIPVSSQSSSKRIIRDGMLAVTNSDSDSIDADSDPLDDIDELIRRKRLKMTPPAPSSEHTRRSSAAARELRSSTRRDNPAASKYRTIQPPRKTYKFSLASLVASSAKDAASDQRIQQYQSEYQQEVDETARLARELHKTADMDAEEFAEHLQADDADDETKERFVRAIKRNDVLEKDVQYRFFRHSDSRTHEPRPFPGLESSSKDWTSMLQDPCFREESFRSGFAADMSRISALPDEIIDWVFSELLGHVDADLADGYIGALENSFENRHFTTESLRRQILLRAGREDLEPDLFGHLKSMPPPAHHRPYIDEIPLNLKWVSLLLNKLASRLRVAERRTWLPTLMLLLLDPQLEQDVDVQAVLQTCIADVLDADAASSVLTATIEYVGQRILVHAANPVLIQRLISLLPSSTAASHSFKRRLALASFMKSKSYLTNDLDDVSTLKVVTSYLRENQKFKIRENTDFNTLGARFGALDVAMGLGFSKFDFYSNEATTKADSPVGTGMARPTLPLSEKEAQFDSAIDEVVAELRSVAFNIRDSGATHMRRTECKTAIEKLSYRLEFSARTRPKPKKGIFGAAEGASDVMRNFIGRPGEPDIGMDDSSISVV